jgi:hypothetical protein
MARMNAHGLDDLRQAWKHLNRIDLSKQNNNDLLTLALCRTHLANAGKAIVAAARKREPETLGDLVDREACS